MNEVIQMPHDEETEWNILALIFTDPTLIHDLLMVPDDAFYMPVLRSIFAAMKKVARYGHEVSLPLVRDVLSSWGKLSADVENMLTLMSLRYTLADVPVYWSGYVDKLLALYHKRLAIRAGQEIIEAAQKPLVDSMRIVQKAREKVQELEERVSLGQAGVMTPAELVEVLSAERQRLEIPSSVIAGITEGFEPGEMVVVAARPGVGKTALLLIDAYEISASVPVLFVSREMSEWEIMQRLHRYAGNSIQEELPKRQFFLSTTARTPMQIALAARSVGARVVFVDYLQRLESGKRHVTREQEIGDISHALKDVALDNGFVVVVAAQLNRESEKRENREPYLSDLRDSGRIEQDANSVILLWRNPFDEEEPFTVYWKLAKNRRGALARGELTFVPSRMVFYVE